MGAFFILKNLRFALSCECCKGERKTANGYSFAYAE